MQKVIIVHAIDAEGPLYEDIKSKFERIKDLFGIDFKNQSASQFNKIINSKKKEYKNIQEVFSGHIGYRNDNWKKLKKQNNYLFSKNFREKYLDSFGNSWKFTWHCLDHINYIFNPRKRALGHHVIFDYYNDLLKKKKNYGDSIEWHFHPMSTYYEAHRCATSYFRSNEVYEILSKKIIDRNFFPSSYRAGFQVERPDSNWFLEQWIPFDISNTAVKNIKEVNKFLDMKNGRGNDWRFAPSDWCIYHPSHDNYQIKGNSRRWIGRSLNILNRFANINQNEVDSAFKKAQKYNKPVLMGVTGHDWRKLESEVKYVYELILNSKKKYKSVKFEFCNTTEGFQKVIWPYKKVDKTFKLKVIKKLSPRNDYPSILVIDEEKKLFGPQPYFCIKTKYNKYLYDNFDFTDKNKWEYSFRPDTINLNDVDKIGIAGNDKFGNKFIKIIKI